MKTSTTLIRNTTVGSGPYAGRAVDVLMANGKISKIAQGIDAPDALVVDGTRTLLSPGFVDGHRHLWQALLRGRLANTVLADYYRQVRVGYAAVYTPEDVYLGVYAGAIDALCDGVTTVLDHCHIINSPAHADAAAAALKDAGIRAIFCYGFYEPPVKNKAFNTREDRYKDIARIRRDHFPGDDGLVTLGAALTESWLVPAEVILQEVNTANALGLKNITAHVGSNPAKTDISRMQATQCFGPAFAYSHCNTCADEVFDFVADTGGSIIATPETELGMGMGFPVTNKALRAKVPFGLGVDIVSYANGDMLTAGRLALQTARMLHCQPAFEAGEMPRSSGFKTSDALDWITGGGAAALGLSHKVGIIEEGMEADLVLFDTARLSLSPMSDPATALTLHASVRDMKSVWVRGELRMQDGKPVGLDYPGLIRKVENAQAAIDERIAAFDSSASQTSQAYENLITKS